MAGAKNPAELSNADHDDQGAPMRMTPRYTQRGCVTVKSFRF
jgi:hypothetical protein